MPDHTRTEDDRIVGLNDQLRAYARDLRGALARARAATDELSRTHLETVAALAAAIDVRDEVTGGHVYRVANYGLILAGHLEPDLAADPQLIYGFLLHDIGKLGVPDRILLKTGPLDPDERAQMRHHVEYGVKFIDEVSFPASGATGRGDPTAHRFADPERARADARSLPRELFSNPSETTLRIVEPEPRTIRRIARTLYDDHGTAIGRLLEYRDVTRREARSDDRLEDARAALGDLLASPDTAPEVRTAAADALDRLADASGH